MSTYTIDVHTSSADSDGVTVTATGGPYKIGGDPTYFAAQLRFQTSAAAIPITEKIKICKLIVKVQAKTGSPPAAVAYAADFGAAIAAADYGVAPAVSNTAPIRHKLQNIIPTTAVVDDFCVISVPPRFINRDVAVNSGYTDIEIRPGAAIATTEKFSIYGSGGTGSMGGIEGASEPEAGEGGSGIIVTSGEKPALYIRTVTPAQEVGQNEFNEIAVRDGSYLAFDTEADTAWGYPVKGKHMLDVVEMDFDSDATNLYSEAIQRNRQRPGKAAVGTDGAGGSASFEITPEVWPKLLLGFFKVDAVTGSDPYTAALVPANYKEVKRFTFVKKYGNDHMRCVYRGCVIGTLSISARYGQITRASVSVLGRQEYPYTHADAYGADSDEYVLGSTAAYDANGLCAFNGTEVHIDSVANYGTIPGFTLTLNNSAASVEGLRRRRDITGHIVGGLSAEISFELHFENDVMLRNFMAYNDIDDPWMAGNTLVFNRIDFKLAGPDGATTQEIVFTAEKFLATTIRKPIPSSEGPIILPVVGMATLGQNTVSSIITATVKNSHPATYWDDSADPITVIPADALLP